MRRNIRNFALAKAHSQVDGEEDPLCELDGDRRRRQFSVLWVGELTIHILTAFETLFACSSATRKKKETHIHANSLFPTTARPHISLIFQEKLTLPTLKKKGPSSWIYTLTCSHGLHVNVIVMRTGILYIYYGIGGGGGGGVAHSLTVTISCRSRRKHQADHHRGQRPSQNDGPNVVPLEWMEYAVCLMTLQMGQ